MTTYTCGKIAKFSALGLAILLGQLTLNAQTWVGTTSDWNTASNWNPATVPGTSSIAVFGATLNYSINSSAYSFADTLKFTAAATQAYTFSGEPLFIVGAGIKNNSAFSPIFNVGPGVGGVYFENGATAANATINDSVYASFFENTSTAAHATITNTNAGGVEFINSASGGNATIINNGGYAAFLNSATANKATITNEAGYYTLFSDTADAGTATITNTGGGFTTFTGTSTANQATITNDGGYLEFSDSASAGAATIVNKQNTFTSFSGSSTAGTAMITNKKDASTSFGDTTTAGASTIIDNKGGVSFSSSATAGTANITNENNGFAAFSGSSTAGASTITNETGGNSTFSETADAGTATLLNSGTGFTVFENKASANQSSLTNNGGYTLFENDATAHQSTITNSNGGTVTFTNHSDAAKASILNESGGTTYFSLNASGNHAEINNETGGTLDISGLTNGGTSVGIVEGAGNVFLGGNNLTILGRNGIKNPLVSGTISDGGTDGGTGGSLTLDSSGNLILTGANTYTGGTTVQMGILKIGSAGALGTGNVTVTGGTLKTYQNFGQIDVGGNYDQTGGNLQLKLTGSATNDNQELLTVGNITLGGSSNLILKGAQNVTVTAGLSYDLAHTTDGTVSGQFGSVSGLNNFNVPTGLFASFAYSSQDITLSFFPFLANISGLTPNQQAVATYIDGFAPTVKTGNFGTLVQNLYPLFNNIGSLGDALDQISPQSLQVFRHVAFDNQTFSSQLLNDHLANLRDGLTGFDGSHLQVTDSSLMPTLSQINSRLLAWNPVLNQHLVSDTGDPVLAGVDMGDGKAIKAPSGTPTDRWSTFVAGNVILADLNHDQDLAHQDYTSESITVGADYRIDDHFTVGAMFGYAHTDATLDHIGSTATVDSYSPGVYASYVDGGWYGNGLFAYNYNSYTENRNIQIGALNGTNVGTPEGNQFDANLTGGYEFHRGNWKFGPMASLQYVNLGINSFSEQGPTALNVQSQSDQSLRSQLGIEARYSVQTVSCYGPMTLTPHASASWQHEYLDDSRGITSQFNQLGAGSFTVQTTDTQRDAAFLDLGLDTEISQSLTLFIDYQTEVGQSNYFAQSVQGGLKIAF